MNYLCFLALAFKMTQILLLVRIIPKGIGRSQWQKSMAVYDGCREMLHTYLGN